MMMIITITIMSVTITFINDNQTSEEKQRAIDSLTYCGCSFEDLCLDFTLPCYPDIEMVEQGRDIPLTPHNLGEYLDVRNLSACYFKSLL